MDYLNFITRNSMLITDSVQEELKNKKILLCGCGIGSYLAEALLRMGCLNLTLVDMDTVSDHNLNRQNFVALDIDHPKVFGLKKRLDSIYPAAHIKAINEPLSKDNVYELVSDAEIVIDTIDYLDLQAILLLHKHAQTLKKPLISAMSVGFGAGLFYFPPAHKDTLEDYIEKKQEISLGHTLYQEAFVVVLKELLPFFDDDLKIMLENVAQKMKEKKPCPASHVSAGTICCASLVATCVEHIVRKDEVTPFPKFHYVNLHHILKSKEDPILK